MPKIQQFQRFQEINQLTDRCLLSRLYQLLLFDFKTFHKPSELLPTDRLEFIFTAWPLKTTVFKSLVQKNKSVTFPKECLDTITPSPAKDKKCGLKRIHPEVLLY